MTISNGYCTLAEAKARLGIADAADDSVIENVVEAVSRWIDHYTGRRFFAASDTRYYSPEWSDYLEVDDLISVTTLKTDADGDRVYETTWATTDYELDPPNAQVETPSRPYNAIRVTPLGRYAFPAARRAVQIVGSFGYASTTPDAINEACLLMTGRVFRRKDAPFGVVGSPDLGAVVNIRRLDPDVEMLLASFRRVVVGAA